MTLDLRGLTALESIGGSFAEHCEKLRSVNISGLPALLSIGMYFADENPVLEEIDARDLPRIARRSLECLWAVNRR